jgi:hypothetical protein
MNVDPFELGRTQKGGHELAGTVVERQNPFVFRRINAEKRDAAARTVHG